VERAGIDRGHVVWSGAVNELLQQLLSMGPAIGAGVSGNGANMQAFMEGYQRTQAQLQQQGRLKQQDQIAGEDRQRLIERQTLADQNAASDRTRAGQVNAQTDALRSLQVPGALAEVGSGAETPEAAQALIESLMPKMMAAFGPEAMAFGQPAVEQAQKVITGRQKKQVESFVDAALKTDHIANNPDADPELTNLPEHIRKIVGKPTARLSELQSYAQLPVGKPQGKTRIPPMPGSSEEFSDPTTTPERRAQILADRRQFTEAGREPDKPNPNAGAYPPAQQRRIDAIVKGFDSQPIVKRTQTMAEAVTLAESLDLNTKNPADDQMLISSFAKAMDPDSVVREGEYNTVQKYSQSWAEKFGFDVARMFSNTSFLTPQARAQMKETIRAKFAAGRGQYDNVRREYGRKIERITGKTGGVDELTDFGAAFPQESAPAQKQNQQQTTGGFPKAGTRRKKDGVLYESDGTGWLPVKP
jgi:hypothetical protein